MNINRNNFEEFCLLYLDGELSQAERQELEAFVAANPDLAVELDLLQQLKLKPETEAPVFFDKSSLFRSSAMENEAIHSGNYETYFLLYTDDELDAEGRRSVERFVMDHPEYQKEFNLLQASRLVAEPVSFPDKSLLYRKTSQPARITVIRYWKVAAAAAVILGGIWIGVNTQNEQAAVEPIVAKTQTGNEKKNDVTKENKTNENKLNEVAQTNTNETKDATVVEAVKQAPAKDLTANRGRSEKKEVKVIPQESKESQNELPDEQLIAVNDQNRTNNLPTEQHNTTVEQPSIETETGNNPVTRSKLDPGIIDRPSSGPNAENAKNNFASEALLTASETNAYTVNTAAQEDEHKSPLRGVFRKASRIINRVTNPDIFKPTSKQNK